MSKRFIVNEENILKQENSIRIKSDEVHHINVLRYKVGERIYINEYELEIVNINKEELVGNIVGELPQKGIPKVDITLIQSYLKSDKMDYVVQKAVELGVKEIKPVISKNTIVKLDYKDKIKKLERLNKIAKEAIEQCGRSDSAIVNDIEDISNINWSSYDSILVCHEKCVISLKEVLNEIKGKKKIAIVVGPEGGLENSEVEEIIKNNNAYEISLGERILRAETASLNILSIVGYEFG